MITKQKNIYEFQIKEKYKNKQPILKYFMFDKYFCNKFPTEIATEICWDPIRMELQLFT